DVAATGIGTGLEYRPDFARGILQANRGYGLSHRGGVMGKVVDDQHSSDLRPNFLAPADAGERGKAAADLLGGKTQCPSGGVNTDRIFHVLGPSDAQLELGNRLAALHGGEACALRREGNASRGVVGAGALVTAVENDPGDRAARNCYRVRIGSADRERSRF